MREATVRNLCAETLSLPSFTNGNSLGRLRAPERPAFSISVALGEVATGFALGFHAMKT